MPRARSNVPRLKRKKQIMKAARGAYGGRSKLWKAAKENVERGWRYAYRDRKNPTRDFESARTLEELEAARVRHLGDAQGRLRVLQHELGALAKEERPSAGRR